MINYPAFDQLYTTRFEPRGMPKMQVYGSGAQVRNLAGARIPGIYRVVHICTDAQIKELVTHYEEHRAETFAFIYQKTGASFQVEWLAPPSYSVLRLGLYVVNVSLMWLKDNENFYLLTLARDHLVTIARERLLQQNG